MKKEDIIFLNELQQELNTQSNCGNASPVYWVIRQCEKQITDSDFGEETLYIHSDGNLGVFSYYGLTARNIKYCPMCGRSLE
ncbi:hypothetical protein L5S95_002728 [Listeria monocytogenes]|nr:hypothetical protein [Listeria monocytogenes]